MGPYREGFRFQSRYLIERMGSDKPTAIAARLEVSDVHREKPMLMNGSGSRASLADAGATVPIAVLQRFALNQTVTKTGITSMGMKSDEQEILEVLKLYEKSINDADTKLAEQIWSQDPEVSFVHPKGWEHGWIEVKNNFYIKLFRERFSKRQLRFREIKVSVYGDFAWTTFYWMFDATFKDESASHTEGRETQILKKVGDDWKIVHIQYQGSSRNRVGKLRG